MLWDTRLVPASHNYKINGQLSYVLSPLSLGCYSVFWWWIQWSIGSPRATAVVPVTVCYIATNYMCCRMWCIFVTPPLCISLRRHLVKVSGCLSSRLDLYDTRVGPGSQGSTFLLQQCADHKYHRNIAAYQSLFSSWTTVNCLPLILEEKMTFTSLHALEKSTI